VVNEQIELLQELNPNRAKHRMFSLAEASGHPSLASLNSQSSSWIILFWVASRENIDPSARCSEAKEVNALVVSVKSADQKKEFNFFANFVPPFPENESEPYASEPEIKFLVSRKTSATMRTWSRRT
jgi:hypothetical protein